MGELSVIKAVLLGLLYGITEFFPVSSKAHQIIAQSYLGIRSPVQILIGFDLLLRLGALAAAVVYFRHALRALLCCRFKPLQEKGCAGFPETKKEGLFVLAGCLPVVLMGVGFHRFFGDLLSDGMMAAIFLLINGSILNATQRFLQERNHSLARGEPALAKVRGSAKALPPDNPHAEPMGLKKALLIGLAQILSMIPGLSRTGITLSTGLYLKLDVETAFRYAILMMVPITVQSIIMDMPHLLEMPLLLIAPSLLGGIAAGVAGFYCIRFLRSLLLGEKFSIFAWYCWIVGGLVLLKEMFF